MIRLVDVRKTYPTRLGQNLVLDGVSFELNMGERLGILGRNGAGKSTMVRLISGAEYPTSGQIERTISVSWPLAFGGAFQPMLTGRDNVRFISRLYGQDFEPNLEFVQNFAELGQYLSEPVINYSSGMRARLAFAMSMIIEFDCFLIDEIAAVGDARFHSRCNYELFEKRSDRAMIIVSHDASYIRDHCTRWSVLHDGRLTLFDEFEPAYSSFKELIGVSEIIKHEVVQGFDRTDLISTTRFKAMADDRFQAIAREGDWGRDDGRWVEGAEAYQKALLLYPYHSAYWTQLGHVLKEIPRFEDAEIAYRTAFALGEPAYDVIPFLKFVVESQGLVYDDFIAAKHVSKPAHAISPGAPDIELFWRLIWPGIEVDTKLVLDFLRSMKSCDDLVAWMIRDPRFKKTNSWWLEERISSAAEDPTRTSQLDEAVKDRLKISLERDELLYICRFIFPLTFELSEDRISYFRSSDFLLQEMLSDGAFSEWPEAQEALRATVKLRHDEVFDSAFLSDQGTY